MMIWTEILTTIRHFQLSRQGEESQDFRTFLGILTAKLLEFFGADYVAVHQVHQIPIRQGDATGCINADSRDRPKVIWEPEVCAEARGSGDRRVAESILDEILLTPCPWRDGSNKNIFEIFEIFKILETSEAVDIHAELSTIFADKTYCVTPILGIDSEIWGCLSVYFEPLNFETRAIGWSQDNLAIAQQIAMQIEILLHYEIQQDRLQKLNQEMDNSYSILFQWTEQYRSLIEQVPSASYVLPIDGNMDFSYISPRLQTILAIPLKIWNTGYINGWKQYIHPNDRDRFQAAVSEAIADGGSFNCEYRMITYDGRIIWVSDNASVGMSDDGYTRVLRGSILDISDRKESELRFRGIFDNTFQFVGLLSTDGILLEVNQTALDFGGIGREQVIGLPVWETHWLRNCPENQDLMRQAVQRASQGEFVRYEMDISGRNQTFTTVDFSVRPVKDESGRVILLIPEGRDISEIKATEMALRKSEAKLEEAQRIAKLGYWEWNLATNKVSWSQELFKIFKRDPILETLSYENILDFFEPRDRSKLSEAVNHTIATGESYRLELKMLQTHPYDSASYLEAIGHGEFDTKGKVARLYGTVQDISDRKNAELKLLENKTLLKLTIDNAPIGIATFDLEGKFLTVNYQFCQIFGYSHDEILRMTAIEITHPDSVDRTLKALNQLITNQVTTVQIAKQYLHKSGHPVDVISRVGLVRDVNGKPLQFVAGVEDISERQQIEKKLATAKLAEAANRAKSEFLAVMSHELRTPMNAVLGMTEILMGTDLSEQQQQYVATIRQGGEVLVSIINDILDFSRIESGYVQIEEAPISLQQCLEEVLDLMTAKMTEKALEISMIIDQSVPLHVLSDYVRLRQILVNLVSNAIKFTECGEVIVTVSAQLMEYELLSESLGEPLAESLHESLQPEQVAEQENKQGNFYELLFQVQDSGIGIAPEAIARLFQPFSQADYSISRRYGGTGLGLAICKQLCEKMGGAIAVESTVGQGSNFKFSIRAQAIASPPLEIAPELINKNILIISEYTSIQKAIALYAQTLQVTAHSLAASELISNLSYSVTFNLSDSNLSDSSLSDSNLSDSNLNNSSLNNSSLNNSSLNNSSLSNFDAVLIDHHLSDGDAIDLAAMIKQAYPDLPLVLLAFVTNNQNPCPEIFDSCLIKPITATKLQKTLTNIFQSPKTHNSLADSASQEEPPLLDPSFADRLPLKILIVEDNPVNQQILQLMLELLGYQIQAVENGLEALREISQHEYDLIFMDIQMPIMDGLTASEQIRQLPNRQPWIIGLSADAFTESRDVAIAAGMDDYLTKPLQIENLLTALQKIAHPLSSKIPTKNHSFFDVNTLRSLESSIGKQNMMNLILVYLNHSTQAIADMKVYLQNHNIAALDAVNHSLKGGSATFGVTPLFNVCQELELICQNYLRNPTAIDHHPALAADLENKFHQVESIFHEVLQSFDQDSW